ncbi:MAG: aconitate hydratase AcnA [Gaiellales bacterium]|nr:aconitate hydratase AcnA [Gaiellales bacterium]
MIDPFDSRRMLRLSGGEVAVSSLPALEGAGLGQVERLPYCVRILLENVLRHCGRGAEEAEVVSLAAWTPGVAASSEAVEVPFHPSRVIMQDLTGLPCLVDLAALRAEAVRRGLEPGRIDPLVPVDLVIDHSVHMDVTGRPDALQCNMDVEFGRNRERYEFFRWAQRAFGNLRVVPPGAGIVHQVNLEYLAPVVHLGLQAFPDTVVGTDSHTTMINGLGVLGWGVGGIEAEAAMLGRPLMLLPPRVVGVRLSGRLHGRATATDAALTLTRVLRSVGVVDSLVEFFGPAAAELPVADRATLANMAPEYGATCGYFPVDAASIGYLLHTARNALHVADTEKYLRAQKLFRESDPEGDGISYDQVVEFDLTQVEPAIAGPRRPQDVVPLGSAPASLTPLLATSVPGELRGPGWSGSAAIGRPSVHPAADQPEDGAVVVAAITSCTNTSNPAAMLTAGLLARNAQQLGLRPAPWVKTSLAPGSRTVTAYLEQAGLLPPLEALGFQVAGYGCATCIGNSGELLPQAEEAIARRGILGVAVLSGNRNFEGRIHPLVKANYLASPPLVVAYALAGNFRVNLLTAPLGLDQEGEPVFLSDIWPERAEVEVLLAAVQRPGLFGEAYAGILQGEARWAALSSPRGAVFEWAPDSTYVREPPFLAAASRQDGRIADARLLALLGDSVTTDHISPAGSIPWDAPAGLYLREHGIARADFNSYGARRGNHEVMMRGTFANTRLRNRMAGEREGGWTVHHPSGDLLTIYEASRRYGHEGVPLVVAAGREYGSGSSRDWAAKGPALLGVRAVIAQSFERIHRSNLVGMGILPLQFLPGEGTESWGLAGSETLDIEPMPHGLAPKGLAEVTVRRQGEIVSVRRVLVRLDAAADVSAYQAGGIIPAMLAAVTG